MSAARRILIPLDRQCRALDLPEPVAEFRFHAARRWRFDWAWPERLVAVEIDGGVWIGGRHNRAGGYLADMEKLNAAAEAGWRVLRYATGHIDMAQLARVLA
jgi:very-short-patch-repair endonuclease